MRILLFLASMCVVAWAGVLFINQGKEPFIALHEGNATGQESGAVSDPVGEDDVADLDDTKQMSAKDQGVEAAYEKGKDITALKKVPEHVVDESHATSVKEKSQQEQHSQDGQKEQKMKPDIPEKSPVEVYAYDQNVVADDEAHPVLPLEQDISEGSFDDRTWRVKAGNAGERAQKALATTNSLLGRN